MRCPGELRELLMQLADPEGPVVDYELLAEILQDNPTARQYYRQFMDLHARLELLHDTPLPMPELLISGKPVNQQQLEQETVKTDRTTILTNQPPWLISTHSAWGFACGVVVLLVPLLLWAPWNQPAQEVSQSGPVQSILNPPGNGQQSIGQITRIVNCQWRSRPLLADARLVPGDVIDIDSGQVAVRMANGASVVVEGPAKFLLQTSGSGYLNRGKISCNVPENADGFTVLTPSATVVDLGTTFGVWVNGKGVTETHVLSGMVGLQPRSVDDTEGMGSVKLVSRHQSARVAPGPKAIAEYVDYNVGLFSSLIPSPRTTPVPPVHTILAHPSGGVLYSNGQGMLFGAHSKTGSRRVGVSKVLVPDSGSKLHLRLANVLVFRLPKIPKSSQIDFARLEWTYPLAVGTPNFSVDLYGLGAWIML